MEGNWEMSPSLDHHWFGAYKVDQQPQKFPEKVLYIGVGLFRLPRIPGSVLENADWRGKLPGFLASTPCLNQRVASNWFFVLSAFF